MILVSSPFAVLAALLLLTAHASGDPCEDATYLEVTEPAPCTGSLLPEAWARRCLECGEVDLPRCKRDLALARVEASSREEAAANKLREALDALGRCERIAAGLVGEPRTTSPPWSARLQGIVAGSLATGAIWAYAEDKGEVAAGLGGATAAVVIYWLLED